MKQIQYILSFLILLLLTVASGCSNRIETPVTTADSTIVYPAKKAEDITVKINLCRNINKKSGQIIGAGTVFTIMEDEKIYAYSNIKKRFCYGEKELMFHINWIKPNGKSLFQKRIDIFPDDSTKIISSSFSISPDREREPGEYIVQVYLFRELIAEKKFKLLPELIASPSMAEELAPNIILYRKVSKKTGKRIGEGTVFKIKRKRKVRALVEFGNRFAFGNYDLLFYLQWIGPDGDTIYRKGIKLYQDDTTSTIRSSISISPDKRHAGEYIFRLLLFHELIAEKKFELYKVD